MSVLICDVGVVDLFGIFVIYNDVVGNIMVIWNEILVDLVNCQVWFDICVCQGYLILVVSDVVGEVFGYVFYGDW